jgi:hypothetical protein
MFDPRERITINGVSLSDDEDAYILNALSTLGYDDARALFLAGVERLLELERFERKYGDLDHDLTGGPRTEAADQWDELCVHVQERVDLLRGQPANENYTALGELRLLAGVCGIRIVEP